MAGLGILIGLVGIAWIAVLFAVLAAILTTPATVWEEAQLNQWMWLAAVLLLPLVGVALFLFVAKPRLNAARPLATPATQ